MQKTILRYGIYAGSVLVILGLVNLTVFKSLGYGVQEIVGYLSIFVAMIFVFMGIKHYRDNVNSGKLSFSEGLKIGALIVIIPALTFGLFDIV
ncbi:MAG TPA: DUF4199 domain-containing protein, partial [Chitinophagaceae bacterium]|nr:DUF4199 domain-containing protein [Chitinophagaceae bacterium]